MPTDRDDTRRRSGKDKPSSKRAKWKARVLRRGSLTGPAFIEFTFPTKGGGESVLRTAYSNLGRRHIGHLLDQFADYLPVFPADAAKTDDAKYKFIKRVVDAVSGAAELLPDRTGFIDRSTFVTHSEILHADGARVPVPRDLSPDAPRFDDTKGTPQGTTDLVLSVAKQSTYLAFAIGVALAAPLPTYVNLYRRDGDDLPSLVRETAVFNFSGTSSSGKSSICLAAMTLAESSLRAQPLDFTRRGLAELASDSNDLLLVLDDTEKAEDGALVQVLKSLVNMVPSGQSKAISRGADQYPPLRWSTFALSSSPRSVPDLARERRWAMSAGDKVRLFNISVPGPARGGVFDRIGCAKRDRAKHSVQLIGKLERGYSNHHGHVMPDWIGYLMAANRCDTIMALVEAFIKHVGVGDHGWERRFAQKFAVVYAAMKMGIGAGSLPWPSTLPLKVATKCYRKARAAADTDQERVAKAMFKLHHILKHDEGAVAERKRPDKPVKLGSNTIAIRFKKSGRVKYGVRQSALRKLLRTKAGQEIFTRRLQKAGVLEGGDGHAGTTQVRFPIAVNGKLVKRPRLWVLDSKKLSRLIAKIKQ